jgi:hypothetical protein
MVSQEVSRHDHRDMAIVATGDYARDLQCQLKLSSSLGEVPESAQDLAQSTVRLRQPETAHRSQFYRPSEPVGCRIEITALPGLESLVVTSPWLVN